MNSCNLTPKFMSLQEAMKLSVKQKRIYFRNAKVLHEGVKATLSELQLMTSPCSGTQIVFLVGPTGVGKSFLIDLLKESIIKENMPEILEDPSYIPVIAVETPSSGEKIFSWQIFYNKLGAELNEVLMDKKVEHEVVDGRIRVKNVTTRSTIAARREAVERAIGKRRTALMIIDEAIHLMRDKESNALTKKMDTLKSLANIHGTSIVLVGSYDLYKLMNQYGQVARRSTLVHFERYRSEKPDDVTAFTKSLSKLQKALPVEGEPDLTPFAKALMLPCTGCVGTLKDTLQRALNICLTSYKGKWSEKCLEKALLSKAQVTTILEEITDGEERIQGASFGCNSLTET